LDVAWNYVTSSKSLIFTLIIIAVGVLAFVGASIADALGESTPMDNIEKLYYLLFGGNTAGVTRNIISDGIMPRVPQAIGASHNPQIALESPTSMKLSASNQSKDQNGLVITNVIERT
jgi:hypothetical protein